MPEGKAIEMMASLTIERKKIVIGDGLPLDFYPAARNIWKIREVQYVTFVL